MKDPPPELALSEHLYIKEKEMISFSVAFTSIRHSLLLLHIGERHAADVPPSAPGGGGRAMGPIGSTER